MDDSDLLAQLMAARLNHDYVSPLTAISNGLELFHLDNNHLDEVIKLIEDSLHTALSELQFNRIAFGSYGDDEKMSLNEAQRRIINFFRVPDFKLTLTGFTEDPFKMEVKLLFLSILCIKSSFISVNSIILEKTDHGYKIEAEGMGIQDRSGEYRAENNWLQIIDPTPNTVHFALFFKLNEKFNNEIIRKVDVTGRITINIWKKAR